MNWDVVFELVCWLFCEYVGVILICLFLGCWDFWLSNVEKYCFGWWSDVVVVFELEFV